MNEALDAVLAASRFDLGRVEQGHNGRTVTYSRNPNEMLLPGALQDLATIGGWGDEAVARARAAKAVVPDDVLSRWCSSIGEWFEQYVNPQNGTIGHAFPMESSHWGYEAFEGDGVMSIGSVSPLAEFAKALLRGAAIMGSAALAEMLTRWLEGGPVRYRTSAILNGLYLSEKLAPFPGVRIEPLPRSTDDDFGSLPVLRGNSIEDFLGRSVLSIESIARPALFRPAEDGNASRVQAEFVSPGGLNTVCRALALEADSDVELAFQWNDYAGASLYLNPRGRSTYSTNRRGLERQSIGNSVRTDIATGVKTVSIHEQNVRHLSEDRLESIIGAMARQQEASIDIAITRWCKSGEGFKTLADQFIDLRVALEALYLKNFDPKNRGEMKLRLALYGAWHLGSNLAERKEIRKTLSKAYDMGSRAVHGDSVPNNTDARALLSTSRALCRRGILKFLADGVRDSWDEMILGGNQGVATPEASGRAPR